MVKYLVTYAFHIINDNVKYFLQHGLINNPNITYVFVQNGNIENSIFNDLLQQYHNLFLYIRNNEGLDFQAYNNVLFLPQDILKEKYIIDNNICQENYLYQLYDKFIFLNCSVIGPYTNNWVQKFTAPLSDNVALCGTNINFLGCLKNNKLFTDKCHSKILTHYNVYTHDFTHVQSMIFAMNIKTLILLFTYNFFSPRKEFPNIKKDVIYLGEIAMSAILRKEQKSLYSFMPTQLLVTYDRIDNTEILDMWNSNYTYSDLIFVKPEYMLKFFDA